MRTLEFIVEGDILKQKPSCNFSGLFPGKNDQVQAKFVFSDDWKSSAKVAAFRSILHKEYPPQVINDDETCMIPVEALARPSFRMQIIGKRYGTKMETNQITIYQRGGAV